ncbi:fungal specific transcription factor domain-containing protein [Colletotrichum orchidophilum]|uniref:Fungal specific transcription factor domain-containing protein n=1 Tax=Colletotrichum orchidophilum TaxID=1209926 RepID=A0A1G4B752_9PEZI|nr:fungal specific transcription factor domain-containing protein [Colletotrichum orchidophilum]OHE97279.1 fungal specific transcription factor domain-containing protein [Colletotrichum orchidophilum]
MESSNTQRRITKRSSYAYVTGHFADKVFLSRYLSELQQKVARLERAQARALVEQSLRHAAGDDDAVACREGNDSLAEVTSGYAHLVKKDDPNNPSRFDERRRSSYHTPDGTSGHSPPGDGDGPDLTNPLTATPSRFCMSASNGQPYFLGSSSNWSFSRQVLSVTYEHVCQSPLPTNSLLFDGFAYDLGWDGSRTTQTLDNRLIPSHDYAIFLINAVKFHCGQMFHLFEEDEFMLNMQTFYSKSSTDRAEENSLWYIHFLVILAFGKSLIQRKTRGNKRPAGADFFVRALQLLPDVTALCKEPIMSTEILCSMAWYYQALDFRHAAHNFIGQAKSVAMNHGMHTDMPIMDLGPGLVQRCRKIWWTVYVLDRQMTSLMGLPQSTLDEGVFCQLPSYPGSVHRTTALSMQIKFARIIAEISSTVYGANGRLNKKFVLSTKAVLQSIVAVADELRTSFPLFADERFDGISRLSAHLHLLYYQCIILATRPLLLCCLIKRFNSPLEADSLMASPKVRNPLQMCAESGIQILNILDRLRAQGLLETFLPLDLDSLFVSMVALLVARGVDSRLIESQIPWVDKSHAIIEEMVASGNLIAEFRKNEMQKLEEMLLEFDATRPRPLSDLTTTATIIAQQQQQQQQPVPSSDWQQQPDTCSTAALQPAPLPAETRSPLSQETTLPVYRELSKDSSSQAEDLTTQQIIDVVNSMEWEDNEWMSFTMVQDEA